MRVINLGFSILSAFSALVVGAGGFMPLSAATASTGQAWNLTSDFASHPTLNPAPDQYGNPGVWGWKYGMAGMPSTFKLLDKTDDPGCGVKNIHSWQYNSDLNPNVSYNPGPAIPNWCGSNETWPTHTVLIAPGDTAQGTGNIDSIVDWKSPITASVHVSITIQGINP